VIPLINVYGFINFSRDVPSGKDINRSFPGTIGGSLASRVAGFISKHILPQVDVIVDCHTGALNHYNYPQVRVSREDAVSYDLARTFNAPFILPKGHIRGSLRRAAHKLGKPCIIYEGGEAARLDEFAIAKGINGIRRLLASLGMIDMNFSAVEPSIEILHASWLRAPGSGIFTANKHAGMPITAGEPLGVIGDPYGSRRVEVLAPKDGYIIGHSYSPVVNLGDALFHLGSGENS
jgi:predicted deacylase